MALSAKFSLLHSELNDFLFAQMGEEESGAPLSVLSALTRLDIDPWLEGARLAGLPRDRAARVLAPMIAKFSGEKRSSTEVRALAERLVTLLPRHGAAGARDVVVSGDRRRVPLAWLRLACTALIVLLAGMAAFGLLPGQ